MNFRGHRSVNRQTRQQLRICGRLFQISKREPLDAGSHFYIIRTTHCLTPNERQGLIEHQVHMLDCIAARTHLVLYRGADPQKIRSLESVEWVGNYRTQYKAPWLEEDRDQIVAGLEPLEAPSEIGGLTLEQVENPVDTD